MAYRPLVFAMLSSLMRESSAFAPGRILGTALLRGHRSSHRGVSRTATITRSITTQDIRASCHVVGSQKWQRLQATGVKLKMSTTASTSDTGAAVAGSAEGKGRPYYLTTPIYYVNDRPHIGHAYTTLACDTIARFMRLDGWDVMFLTGTDEHGQKVESSAQKAGKTPQAFCDEVSLQFRDLLTTMNFSNDLFIRTTDASHKTAAVALWNTLRERGHIELGIYAGWYSIRDEAFYAESELVDGKAPTGADVEWVEKEPSYFFKLSEWQKPLLEFYEKNPEFIAPQSRRNEAVSFVSGGLKDLSISRTSFSWGVPVPDDKDHVMYVWVDALANYISALGYPDVEGNFGKFWPADLHVIGKDILRFHSVYWPALLLAAGLEPPKRLFVHGWWTKDGQKISKSTGNVIDPLDLVEKYGVDATRYFLMSEVPFGKDGDYSETAFQNRVNSNLANEVGNLAQRTLSMAVKNCGGAIPKPGGSGGGGGDEGAGTAYSAQLTEDDKALLASASECLDAVRPLVGKTQQLHKALEVILQVSRNANKYLDTQAPWKLKKTDPERMETVLWVVLETVRHVAILYQPFVPTAAGKLLDQLGVAAGEARSFIALSPGGAYSLKPGTPLAKPTPIFPRIEAKEEEELVPAPAAA